MEAAASANLPPVPYIRCQSMSKPWALRGPTTKTHIIVVILAVAILSVTSMNDS